MKTLVKGGLTSITVIVWGFALIAITALSATQAVAEIVYKDNRESISVTLEPYNQEYSYCEDGSFSPNDFLISAQVSRDKSGICTKKIHTIRVTGGSSIKRLTKPGCSFDTSVILTPFTEGTLYNVCKDKGPIDVTIERPLLIGLYDKQDRLVREVNIGTATALVHCPERVPDQPPRGSAPRVLTSSSCTRGVDCPPPNNSMASPYYPNTNTSSPPICSQTAQAASEAGAEESANTIGQVPRTWQKPSIVNRVPLAGERTVSSPGIKTLPQRVKPVTPVMQAPRIVNRAPVAGERTVSSSGIKTPPLRVKPATPTMQAPEQSWKAPRTAQETGSKRVLTSTAREPDTRGIVVGTCRNLQSQPLRSPTVGKDVTGRLLFALPDGRSMVLPDGVYKAQNGIRIHINDGSVALVDGILPK